jgi:hypothetical protein
VKKTTEKPLSVVRKMTELQQKYFLSSKATPGLLKAITRLVHFRPGQKKPKRGL